MMERLAVRVGTFRRYSSLLRELVSRDIKVRYRRSFLGLLWTVLNPLLMMMVMTLVFSTIFRSNIENFPVYLLTGNIVFALNADATSQGLMSIVGNAGLIKKVYIPKYLFPLSKVLSCLVNFAFSMIALLFVVLVTRMPLHPTLLLFWIPLFYLFLFTTGLSFILAAVNVYFRDVGHLYSVLLTAWTYLTPIFYPIEILPPLMRKIVFFNPLHQYIKYFRLLIMQGTIPEWDTNLYCLGVGLFMLGVGVYLFKKMQGRFILHI